MEYIFTDRCRFTIDEQNKCTLEWDNGNALLAVTGATTGYIPKYMNLTCTRVNGVLSYNFAAQYRALVAGGVEAKLAFIIAAMRKVASGMRDIRYNLAEITIVDERQEEAELHQDVTAMLRDKGAVVTQVLRQTLSIIGMNGLNMVINGHHYTPSAKMYMRYLKAVPLMSAFDDLAIADWLGPVFHDSFHPIDIRYLANLVCSENSWLVSHVHGVVSRRIPAFPAGTTSIGLMDALRKQLVAFVPEFGDLNESVDNLAKKVTAMVRRSPLDFCATFQQVDTIKNLEMIRKFDPLVAFLAGSVRKASEILEMSNLSTLTAKSLGNVQNSNPEAYIAGANYAEALVKKEVDVGKLTAYIGNLVKSLHEELKTEDHGGKEEI
jgi:hypothetical protein